MDDFDLPSEDASRTPDALVPPPQAYVHVAPLDVDGVRTVEVGTILWGLAFVALLPFYSSLEDSGNLWWLWTCMAGLGLGLLGTEYCRRRRDRSLEASRTVAAPVTEQGPPAPRNGGAGGNRGGGRRRLD